MFSSRRRHDDGLGADGGPGAAHRGADWAWEMPDETRGQTRTHQVTLSCSLNVAFELKRFFFFPQNIYMTLLTLSFTSLSWKDTTNCHRTASMVCWTLLRQVAQSMVQTFYIMLPCHTFPAKGWLGSIFFFLYCSQVPKVLKSISVTPPVCGSQHQTRLSQLKTWSIYFHFYKRQSNFLIQLGTVGFSKCYSDWSEWGIFWGGIQLACKKISGLHLLIQALKWNVSICLIRSCFSYAYGTQLLTKKFCFSQWMCTVLLYFSF